MRSTHVYICYFLTFGAYISTLNQRRIGRRGKKWTIACAFRTGEQSSLPNQSAHEELHPAKYRFGPLPWVPSLSQQNLHQYDDCLSVKAKSTFKLHQIVPNEG